MTNFDPRPFAFALLLALSLAACAPAASTADAAVENGPDLETPVAAAPAPTAAPAPAASAAPPVQAAPAASALPAEACARTEDGAWAFLNQIVRATPETARAHLALAGAPPAPFGIGLVDNLWVYADPALPAGEQPRVQLKLAFAGERFDIDYTRARYSDGDDAVEPYGATARYTFAHTDGCWRLVGQTPMR